MIKPPLIIIILGLAAMAPTRAGAADVQTTAENELARKQEQFNRAKQELADGDKAAKDLHFDVAVEEYKRALNDLVESPYTHDLRAHVIANFTDASMKLAEQRIVEGRYADAEATANTILVYNPNYRPALQLLAHLEDPDYYNKTMGPKFYDKVQEVKRLFVEADGFFASGRYDLAYKRYEQILDLDHYNIAARKGQEKVLAAKLNYHEQAYNTTRAILNDQAAAKWEIAPRKYDRNDMIRVISGPEQTSNTEYLQNKLNRIIIPRIEFKEATVREAIDFLKKRSYELDTTETDPGRKGVNIFLKLDSSAGGSAAAAPAPGGGAPGIPGLDTTGGAAAAPVSSGPAINPADAKITLSLANIPLAVALDYVTKLANLKVKVEPFAVTIVPLSEPTDTLITREYKVPPGFLSTGGATAGSSLAGGVPRAATVPGGAPTDAPSGLQKKLTAREYLEQAGVQFPTGASASFIPSSSKLVVRNTEQNLDMVDTIVETQATTYTQVNIEAKFIEIQQTNMKELSFDYQLGSTTIGRLVAIGGNVNTPTTNFPFTAVTGGQVTSGLRSGSEALTGNAIDALLQGTVAGSTPANPTFAIGGVFSGSQFQMVMRAINQRKGVDLLSAPNVTTKSGQRAVIEVVREFRYPTEYDPPKIGTIGAGGGALLGGAATAFIPVTPTTPTSFETRNTGVTLEVEPVVGPDNQTIDLNLAPQVVEFDGFINYGSPIFGPSTQSIVGGILDPLTGLITGGSVTNNPPTILTPNIINQPVFDTRKVQTSVTVWDGQTVTVGGLVREDVQKVEDKVPGLGDLPVIGRLFRSTVDQHLKRNLVIFVTAHLINPAGDLVHGDEEKEEEVAPLATPDLLPPPPLPETASPK